MSIEETIRRLIADHALATEKLTEQQLAEALRQALDSGDFVRNVRVDSNAQTVHYIPYRERERLKEENQNLRAALEQIIRFADTHPAIVWGFANLYDRSVFCAKQALEIKTNC